jgi:hypothetical protein
MRDYPPPWHKPNLSAQIPWPRQLPEPDPGVHRLLEGVGNLLGPQ